MKTVHAVYFSPTGTTRTVVLLTAQVISKDLDLPSAVHDFTTPPGRKGVLSFGPEDLVIIGLPVYAGRLPNLLLPYLNTLQGGGATAIPLVLFGNRAYDDGLLELGLLLEKQGFHLLAAAAFVGEHAFSDLLGAGRPDRRDLRAIRRFAADAAEKIKGGAPRRSIWALLGEEPRDLKPYYTPRDRAGHPINILKVKPQLDPAKCIDCGRCVTLCPMGSIDPEDVSRIPGVCIKCGACIKGCPAGARYIDDEGYLYHKTELEAAYGRRARSAVFL